MGQKGGKGQGLDTKKKHVNKENVFNEYNVNMVMDFNGLQCYYTNADSLPNKLGELKTRIQERDKKKYDLIAKTADIYQGRQNCK